LSQLENNAKIALSGLAGMFSEVETLISKAKQGIQTNEEKAMFAHKLEQSGILKELTVQYWFNRNDVSSHPNQNHFFKPRSGLTKFQVIPEGDDLKKSFKRLHRWRYSPTAAYGNNEVHLHPYHSRRITVAEALAIQSLPKEFEIPSNISLSDMFKTVGNGVPYLAAKGISECIADYLSKFSN
jgi:DNA (cytosine-5)-methyltransferase 1